MNTQETGSVESPSTDLSSGKDTSKLPDASWDKDRIWDYYQSVDAAERRVDDALIIYSRRKCGLRYRRGLALSLLRDILKPWGKWGEFCKEHGLKTMAVNRAIFVYENCADEKEANSYETLEALYAAKKWKPEPEEVVQEQQTVPNPGPAPFIFGPNGKPLDRGEPEVQKQQVKANDTGTPKKSPASPRLRSQRLMIVRLSSERHCCLPKNTLRPYPNGKEENPCYSPNTVIKWSVALQAAWERASKSGGKKCVRGVVDDKKLLAENPWKQFTWIEGFDRPIRQFDAQELVSLLKFLDEKWSAVTVASLYSKVLFWSWGRREEIASLTWQQLRIVGHECHFQTVGKWGVKKWFRIPERLRYELEAIHKDEQFVFGAYNVARSEPTSDRAWVSWCKRP